MIPPAALPGHLTKRFTKGLLMGSMPPNVTDEPGLFVTAVDQAPDIGILVDAEGNLRYANRQARRMLGLETEAESCRACLSDFIPADELPPWHDFWAEIDPGKPRAYRCELRLESSRLLPVDLHVSKFAHEGSSYLSICARDISHQRIADSRLQETRISLRSILDHAKAPIFVKDLDGAYLLVNERYRRLFGLTDEQILNRTDFDLFNPETAQAFRDADERVLREEQSHYYEELVPVEGETHTYITSKFPLRDEHGEVCALGGIATDITAQKQAQKLAATQAGRIRQLYEAASAPGLTFDQRIARTLETGCRLLELDLGIIREGVGDHSIVRHVYPPAPAARHFSSHEEIEAYPLPDLDSSRFDPESLSSMKARLSTPLLIAGKKFGTLEFYGRLERAKPFHETDHDFVGLMGRWISNRLEIEAGRQREQAVLEELARSNRDLEEFAYIVSHDLQEPLRAISSFSDLLAKRCENELDERAKRYLHHIEEGARRMQTMIRDLLTYSRVQRKRGENPSVPLDEVVDHAIENLQATIQDRGAHIDAIPPLPVVDGDHTQLVQLFQNLLGNAIKFCDRQPDVSIRAEPDPPGRWRIFVQDNGPGIDADSQEQIFGLFERLNRQTQGGKAVEGTGIGLAICRKIVAQHGGRIHVTSAPGRGSTFVFTLPATGSKKLPDRKRT